MRYCDHLGGDECKKWRQSRAEQSRGKQKERKTKKIFGFWFNQKQKKQQQRATETREGRTHEKDTQDKTK